MSEPNKPCTLGPKHTWAFQCNIEKISVSDTCAGFDLKGRYRCGCGARKTGDPQFATQHPPAPASSTGESA